MSAEADVERPVHGLAWRLAASFLIGIVWFAFLVLWLFFLASDYSIYQNLAVFVVSVVLALGLLIAIWLSFGLRFARQIESVEFDWKERRKNWLGWRGAASAVIWAFWFAFLIVWLFFFAGDYDAYQNVAIIIVSMVFAGGVSAILWSPISK